MHGIRDCGTALMSWGDKPDSRGMADSRMKAKARSGIRLGCSLESADIICRALGAMSAFEVPVYRSQIRAGINKW